MLNKKLLTAAVTTALMAGLGSTQVLAADDFAISGNVALVSDYRFRGISQTGEDAAIQGGFDASFEPGFYVGTWASSVDFGGGNDTGSYGTMEIDYYAGWRGPIGDSDFGIDVGYLYYQYPGDTVDPKGDYQEFKIAGSWQDLIVGIYYSDDFYAETDEAWYYGGDYSLSFAEDFSLGFHVGYSDFEEEGFFGDDTTSYTDWSVKLGYGVFGVNLAVTYVDTDLDDEECFADAGICGETAVFSVSKSL
jgi:uncharacterized protein (TIGR02001 family)